MKNNIVKEACVVNYIQAKKAFELGANRLELCFDMHNDGITPSYGTAKYIKENINIPVFCMIRPRGGNFVFNKDEINIMLYDIETMVEQVKADGIVIGCLTKDNEIDIESIKLLINKAREINKNIQITFHMAFDDIKDIENNYEKNIDILIKLGCNRILTKGGKKDAFEGKENIKKFINYAKDRIIIMPGKSITKDNYKDLALETGCKEIHGTKIVGVLN